jgi:hypothetical protein
MNRSKKFLALLHEDEGKEDMGWTGVDLDATLAMYDGWKGEEHIGEPIPAMVDKVKALLDQGKKVKIMTARVCPDGNKDIEAIRKLIQDWCKEHIGQVLPITHEKDHQMEELWDDRVRQVIKNTGKFIDEE